MRSAIEHGKDALPRDPVRAQSSSLGGGSMKSRNRPITNGGGRDALPRVRRCTSRSFFRLFPAYALTSFPRPLLLSFSHIQLHLDVPRRIARERVPCAMADHVPLSRASPGRAVAIFNPNSEIWNRPRRRARPRCIGNSVTADCETIGILDDEHEDDSSNSEFRFKRQALPHPTPDHAGACPLRGSRSSSSPSRKHVYH
jgi:hypothetical protein